MHSEIFTPLKSWILMLNMVWREEQTTDTVGVVSGLGEAFIEQKYRSNSVQRG